MQPGVVIPHVQPTAAAASTAPYIDYTGAAYAQYSAAAAAAAAAAATTTGSPVKKQRPLLPKETAPAVQRVVWNSSSKFQTSSQKWHMQKMQRQQQQQQQQSQQQQQPQSSQGTRYQTRQAVKGTEPPPLLSVAPAPFSPHGQEKNRPRFIFSVPLGCLATVSGRPDTFHLALFFKVVLQLAFCTFLFPFSFYKRYMHVFLERGEIDA